MDVRFINPFLSATANAFSTMLGIPVHRDPPQVDRSFRALADVSGIIGITGQVRGAVVLSFPGGLARRVTEGLIGEPVGEDDPAIGDTVGELANIVAGGVKKEYADMGLDFQISTPTIAAGRNHQIVHKSEHPVIIIPFEADGDTFWVQVSLVLDSAEAA